MKTAGTLNKMSLLVEDWFHVSSQQLQFNMMDDLCVLINLLQSSHQLNQLISKNIKSDPRLSSQDCLMMFASHSSAGPLVLWLQWHFLTFADGEFFGKKMKLGVLVNDLLIHGECVSTISAQHAGTTVTFC